MPKPPRRHPIHGLPFDSPIRNRLRFEYERLPLRDRAAALRKVAQREAYLLLLGQTGRRVARAPQATSRMLWVYNWTTIGDSLMDLAVRRAVPAHVRIDLYIAEWLAPMFAGDPRFEHIYTRIEDCAGPYDFVVMQEFNSRCVRMKIKAAPRAPFATVFGHLRGEQFDRMSFAQRRFEQLFGLPVGDPAPQWLALGPRPERDAARTRIAVGLGAKDPRRWYRRWPEVLQALLAQWPADRAPPEFVLLGNRTGHEDLARFPPELVATHCRVEIDRLALPEVVRCMHECDAFLGADGGLMHLAVACDLPGLALFAEIDPAMRLLSGTRLRSLSADGAIGSLGPLRVADEWLQAVFPDETQNALRTTASICASATPWL